MSHTPTQPPYRRAGSSTAGPAERRRRAQRAFSVLALLGVVGGVLYTNSVLNEQDGASALTGALAAGDDSVSTDMNSAITVDINDNDTGDIDVTSYTITAAPGHGSLGTLNQVTGEIDYTPDANWVGTDSFAYTVEETVGTYFDVSLLNTGRDGAGAIATGVADPNWRISDVMGGSEVAAIGAADGGWAPSSSDASWICGATCNAARDHTVVFHRDVQIVDQSTADHLILALSVNADDHIDEVWVNGAPTGITGGPGWRAGNEIDVVLDPADGAFSWLVGTNTISFQIRNSGAGPMGLLVQPSVGDEDGDGVNDSADRCWGTPSGATVTAEGCRIESGTATVTVANPLAVGCGRTVNGSFEQPSITRNWQGKPTSAVTGWEADPARMEFWRDGFLGANAVDGGQIAELNANAPGTIYQDIPTMAGEELTWSLWHRGRSGTETIEVFVGPPVDLGPGLDSQGQFSTGKTFTNYQGTYVVPEGQGVTRIVITSIQPATGSLGNLVDAVSLEPTGCPVPGVTTTTSTTTTSTSTTSTTTTVPATSTTSTTSTTTTVPATTTTSTTSTTTTVPATTSTSTTTTVPATTTTSTTSTSTTTTVPATTTTSTTSVPATTTTSGTLVGGVDTDGDGTPDSQDPTPLIDATVEFLAVNRVENVDSPDTITYRLRVTNVGPDVADGALVSIAPSAGTLVADWAFDSWAVVADESVSGGASLFGGGLAATPSCWLDATVLRCELGAIASGWGIEFDVTAQVMDDQPLGADATITAIGFDVDLDNNVDTIAVQHAVLPVIADIPAISLAFTGIRFGMLWWIGAAVLLIASGGGMMLISSGRRRDEEAYG